MNIKKIALMAGCAVLLCGCTKSHIIHPEEAQSVPAPDFNLYNNIVVDEEQLQEELDDVYVDPTDYPMAVRTIEKLHLDEGYVSVTAVVKDGTTPEDAAYYADVAIKGVNDSYAEQDFSYGTSGEDTFGGLYQDNEIEFKIYEESAYQSGGEPFYETRIPKDTYMVFDFGSSEEETE